MKEFDCINSRLVEYGQHENGVYWSQLRDAKTLLVDCAITADTMDEVKNWWHDHGVTFADSLPHYHKG